MRIDETGIGTLKLVQDPDEFCYGTDAVLLARFADLEKGLRIADLCTGNGAVAFMADALYCPSFVLGVDINAHEIELAKESLKLNGLEGCMEFMATDALELKKQPYFESFDAVLINPPYQEKGRGVSGINDAKHLARFESSASLSDFFDVAAYILKPRGSLYMVHRPSRLVDLLSLSRERKLEAKRMRMVAGYPGGAANIVLLQFVKGGGHELLIEPEYYVHEAAEKTE